MKLNPQITPFSKYGSNISITADRTKLTVRNIRQKWGLEKLLGLTFLEQNQPIEPHFTASPFLLAVKGETAAAQLNLYDDCGLVIESGGLDIQLDILEGQHEFAYQLSEKTFKIVSIFGGVYVYISVFSGEAKARFVRKVVHTLQRSEETSILFQCGSEPIRLLIRIVKDEWAAEPLIRQWDQLTDTSVTELDWKAFLLKMPSVPWDKHDIAELAWYNLWSCYVRADDYFKYDAVLMSKGSMAAVWSWDHCFNALALAITDPHAAMEQFLLPFEQQLDSGLLPDLVSNNSVFYMVTKPPIHGWCFERILSSHSVDAKILLKVYDHLVKWTEWFFHYRDSDQDGIPHYPLGVDSGWDNSTLFDEGVCLESPDLSAFLVLQMKTLSRLAQALDNGQSHIWSRRAEELLNKLYEHSWIGGGFAAKYSQTHEYNAKPSSLLILMPLILGELLDKEKFDCMAARLEADYLTEHGPATEALNSDKYIRDGYWRGPIWAPAAYLLADGLRRGGREDLAFRIAQGFCNMVEKAEGHYENYDALTGEGLCDTGYTWTASVNILFLNEYLQKKQ